MAYAVITGTFHIFYPDKPRNGPEPDGDTLRFEPDTRRLIERLSGRSADFNGRGNVAIRFEGIDTLETHFQETHQHPALAYAARDYLLAQMGFGAVTFWPDLPDRVQSVQNNPVRGTILARSVESNGRVVAFVYRGTPPGLQDGQEVFVGPEWLDQSMNARLMAAGHAYPAYYTSLPQSLAARLTEHATAAWEAGKGVWAADTANVDSPATITSFAQLQTLAMWPKLFRRLSSYFSAGHEGLGGFLSWLRADPVHRDDTLITPDDPEANMHDIIEITGNSIRMKYWPEEVVIRPDP